MTYSVNAALSHVEAPPISEAMSWVKPGLRNRELLNVSQAVPSYPPAEALQAYVAEIARETETGFYTDILGLPALRKALASHMADDYNGWILPEHVAITAGCNQAFCVAMMVLAKAGDNIVLPVPYYFNHQMWLDMLGIEARHIPGMGNHGARPDVAAAAQAIDSQTRAILLCSPNNPTGSIYPPEVIASFHDLARERGIALVIDETYKDFRPSPEPPHSLFSLPDWQDSFIQLYSFSKIFAMTGYRAGSIIAGQRFIAEAEKVLDCIAICAPHISQRAALFGLQHLDVWKAEKQGMMLARAQALREAFRRPSLAYKLVCAGAYFAYVKHPLAGQKAKDVAKRLAAEHDLLCLPGTMFGPGQEDYLRIAFANVEAELMPQVVERLIESQK